MAVEEKKGYYNSNFNYGNDTVTMVEFCEKLAALLEVSYKDASIIYRTFALVMRREIVKDRNIFIQNVGTIVVKKTKNKKFVSPKGRIIYFDVARSLYFKTSNNLRYAINRRMVGKELADWLLLPYNPTEDEKETGKHEMGNLSDE